MDKIMKAEIEKIFFDYHIRGCELADEKSNKICEQRKQQDIKEITALIIKWLERKKLKLINENNPMLTDNPFENSLRELRNQLLIELIGELV
jgi:hypothetical protein